MVPAVWRAPLRGERCGGQSDSVCVCVSVCVCCACECMLQCMP